MYSTEADFLKRIAKEDYDELVRPRTGDDLTEAEIRDEAIDTADEVINSYIMSVVDTVPLAEPTKMITQCSVDIALFNLHSRIQYDRIPEWVKDRYDACMAWLKDVQSGKANLGLAEDATEELIDKTSYLASEIVMRRDSL
jgi:phage gp36-like protein